MYYKYLISNYGVENKFPINLVVGVYQLKKVPHINKRKEKLKLISMKI